MLICFSGTVIWQQKHDVTTESRREAERWNFFQIIPSLKTCLFPCCFGSIAVGNKLSTGFSVPHIYGPVLVLNYGAWLKMLGILWYTTIKASRRVFVAQHLDNELYKNGTQSKPKHCSLASRSGAFWKIQPVWMETKTLYLCAVCAFDSLHSQSACIAFSLEKRSTWRLIFSQDSTQELKTTERRWWPPQ